jgi:hypothetical protein
MIEDGMVVVPLPGFAARTEARSHGVLVLTSEGVAIVRRQRFDVGACQVRNDYALMVIVQLGDAHGLLEEETIRVATMQVKPASQVVELKRAMMKAMPEEVTV